MERKRNVYSYAGKLTWQANSNHRFDASFFGDPSKGENGPSASPRSRPRHASPLQRARSYGGHNQALRYDGIISPNWLVEASRLPRRTRFIEELRAIDDGPTTDRTVVPVVTYGGIGFYDQTADGTNTQYALKSTNIFNAGGSHQIRYGVQFEDIDYQRTINRTGPTFTLPNGTQRRTRRRLHPDPPGSRRSARSTASSRANLGDPADDHAEVHELVRPGHLADRQATDDHGRHPLGEAEARRAAQPAVLRRTSRWSGAGDGTPGNEINCEYTWSNNWSPRLGAIYDLTGNGKTKLYANYGRFYVKIPNDLAARALVGRRRRHPRRLLRRRPDPARSRTASRRWARRTTSLIAGAAPRDVRERHASRPTSTSSWPASSSRRRRCSTSGVRYIHRDISDGPRGLRPGAAGALRPGLRRPERRVPHRQHHRRPRRPSTDAGGLRACPPQAYFEDPVHKYQAIEITANKAYSDNWSLFASYRWSQARRATSRASSARTTASPTRAITSLFDFPTNDPSYTADRRAPVRLPSATSATRARRSGQGPLPNDRPHQFKLYGNYTFGRPEPGPGRERRLRPHPDRSRRQPDLRQLGRDPAHRCRGGGFETVDGFMEQHRLGDGHQPARGLHLPVRLVPAADAASRTSSTCSTTTARSGTTSTTTRASGPTTRTTDSPAAAVAAPAWGTARRSRLASGVRFEW